jgi:cytochrome c-type biogenesis protein CcmH/NrfG
MANEPTTQPTAGSSWQAKQVYAMAVICLVVGLAIGYLFRGSQSPAAPPQPAANAQAAPTNAQPAAGAMGGHLPSLEEMKQMADKKAAPLLEKLKGDPNNSDLLIQVGNIYKSTHQFKEAASYYDKALQIDPKNVAIRTEMASCLYYNGDVDGAISQLQQSLRVDPKDANSLFNLGMIKWQGKQDSKGALAAWQQLLKSNPQLSAERKATVQKLMADVQMSHSDTGTLNH